MQAITDTKHLTVQTLPPILVLTGEDVGQFEWLKKDILNKIKYLRGQVNNFEHILENVKSSKERKVDAAATSVYYKVKEPNFNKKDLKKYLEDRNEEILELEIALNKANNEILIDID